MAVERSVTGSWCDLEWSGVSVWSAALSVWLCKMWWDGVTLAGCCSGLPAPEGLLPVLHENMQPFLVMFSSSVSIRKPTLAPGGKSVDTINPAGGPGGRRRFPHFYINTDVCYEVSLYCNLPLLRPFSSSFGQLLHPGWEQTVSLLNNSHHFHLILSYHGQFSSWIILWKINLLSLCVMNLERWRVEWWRILNCVCGARDPRVGNVF